MPHYFVDSSALVKRYRYEAGSERLAELLDAAGRLFVSRLAEVEISSAIVRRGRGSGATADVLDKALMRLDRDLADYFGVVELDAATMRNAVGLARAHGLRAADAIQLACAIAARAHLVQEDVVVLGSDQELNAAALAEGLPVLDPTLP